jgi:hypothetical protein
MDWRVAIFTRHCSRGVAMKWRGVLTRDSVRAGHAVVDKPMGLSYEQTEMILNASKERQVPVSVFFNRRWDSDSLTLKRVCVKVYSAKYSELTLALRGFVLFSVLIMAGDVLTSRWRGTLA